MTNHCPHCGRDLARACVNCPLLDGAAAVVIELATIVATGTVLPARDRNIRRRDQRAAARAGAICSVCGRTFEPSRSGAVTCSPACRQKLYRDRKPAG